LYIHLGEEVVIQTKNVIAIFDYQVYKSSPVNGEFLNALKSTTTLVNIANDYTKSIVLTSDKVYLSPLAPNTLKRRAHFIQEFESSLDKTTS
jgi:regulator of extracellular matrix RemA (YlzA/DUF370 family)